MKITYFATIPKRVAVQRLRVFPYNFRKSQEKFQQKKQKGNQTHTTSTKNQTIPYRFCNYMHKNEQFHNTISKSTQRNQGIHNMDHHQQLKDHLVIIIITHPETHSQVQSSLQLTSSNLSPTRHIPAYET